MEIVNIEARTYEALMTRFNLRFSSLWLGIARTSSALHSLFASVENFAQRVETLCNNTGEKSLQKWLDNQDVCEILGICKRTLQTYRDNGKLPYSQIGYKIYYRPEDVEQLIQKLKNE